MWLLLKSVTLQPFKEIKKASFVKSEVICIEGMWERMSVVVMMLGVSKDLPIDIR